MFNPLFFQRKNSVLSGFFVFVCITGLAFGDLEEACEVMYHGDVADLNDSTVIVPEDVVALSSKVVVNTPTEVVEMLGGTPSIFFIIDHSGSMFMQNNNQDRWGERFKVAFALVDSIYNLFDSAEVGVAVFREYLYFDPTDESRFATTPKQSFNGYLPFFQLNSSYSPDGKMGYEIVKQYLDSDTITETNPFTGQTWEYVDLKYRPSNYDQFDQSTNITAGFHAAQHAFESAKYPKNRRFIIFLSDGEATAPFGSENQYITDVQTATPTTFTVFFTQNNTPPQDLVNMTDNIKTNGYSASNEKSDLWTINVGPENLMDFLITNVLNVITSVIVSQPVNITIAGASVSDFNGGMFTFDDHFPLLGETTPFAFEINYKIAKDSIVDLGNGQWDTIVVQSDSTTDGLFNIKIVDGSSLPDSGFYPNKFTMECWERGLSFYNGNNEIFSANETMNDLKVRFDWEPGEAEYAYTNATVELFTVAGNNQDKETLKLDQNGDHFIKGFKQEILNPNENPTPNDGVIQHYADDNLIAVFRNNETPKLPLDTICDTLPFRLGGFIRPRRAYYYDRKFEDGSTGADGYIDSIFIRVETDIDNGLTEAHLKEIMDKKLLTLPEFRDFTIKGYALRSDGFELEVEESKNHEPVTYIRNDDSIVVSELILKVGGWLQAATIPIYDKVAPIIVRKVISYGGENKWTPLLIDFQTDTRDTLIVLFSEPVREVTHDIPFHFLDYQNNKQYTATVNDEKYKNDNQITFSVTKINDGVEKISTGDSIWIYETDRVGDISLDENGDTTSNFQKQSKNRRRVINTVQKLVPFDLTPISISPLDITDINNEEAIVPDEIIILFDENDLNNLHLQQNKDGKYIGMIIQIIPDVDDIKSLPYLELEGTLSIFDALGNQVIRNKPMKFNQKNKTLNYIWNGRNNNDRSVGMGAYLAMSYITKWPLGKSENSRGNQPSEKTIKRFFLGIKQ